IEGRATLLADWHQFFPSVFRPSSCPAPALLGGGGGPLDLLAGLGLERQPFFDLCPKLSHPRSRLLQGLRLSRALVSLFLPPASRGGLRIGGLGGLFVGYPAFFHGRLFQAAPHSPLRPLEARLGCLDRPGQCPYRLGAHVLKKILQHHGRGPGAGAARSLPADPPPGVSGGGAGHVGLVYSTSFELEPDLDPSFHLLSAPSGSF